MSSDDSLRKGIEYKPPGGPGMSLSFRCPVCKAPKGTLGRKLIRLNGLKQFVCKQCLEK